MDRVAGKPFKERFNLGNHTKAFFNVILETPLTKASFALPIRVLSDHDQNYQYSR